MQIYLGDHAGDISDTYFRVMLHDLERLAAEVVATLKPLLATAAALAGGDASSHEQGTYARRARGAAAGGGSGAQPAAAVSGGKVWLMREESAAHALPARLAYLSDIRRPLRSVHRHISRQFEQAQLTVSLAQALQDQYTQRGRDESNDTLYLLTLVTTIVMSASQLLSKRGCAPR